MISQSALIGQLIVAPEHSFSVLHANWNGISGSGIGKFTAPQAQLPSHDRLLVAFVLGAGQSILSPIWKIMN